MIRHRFILVVVLAALPALVAAQPPSAKMDCYGDSLPTGALARLGTARWKHRSAVVAAAWSPDGKTIAAVAMGDPMELVVWDAATGGAQRRLPTWEGMYFAGKVRFSRDGKWLAVSGSRNSIEYVQHVVQVWETATYKPVLRREYGGGAAFADMAFSPDSRWFCVADEYGKVFVYELGTDKPPRPLTGPSGPVWALGLTGPDHVLLASGDSDLQLSSLPDGKPLDLPLQRGGRPAAAFTAAFSLDLKQVAVGGEKGTVHVYDVARGTSLREIKTAANEIAGLAFSADAGTLATVDAASPATLWDLRTGKKRLRLKDKAPGACGTFLILSPDGKTLATGGYSRNALQFFDAATGESRNAVSHFTGVRTVALSPDGKYAATSGDSRFILWDATSGKHLRTWTAHGNGAVSLMFSPDGKQLVSGGRGGVGDNTARVWDVANGVEVFCFAGYTGKESDVRAAYSPDGRWIAAVQATSVSSLMEGEVRLYDAVKGEKIRSFPLSESLEAIRTIGFSPDGEALYTGGQFRLWDPKTGKPLSHQPNFDGGRRVAYSSDGRYLAVMGGHPTKVWETATERLLYSLQGGDDVAFSPDSRFLVLCGYPSKDLTVVDMATGNDCFKLKGHTDNVRALAISADGKRLVSGGDDGVALTWDITDWAKRAPLKPSEEVTAKATDNWWTDLRAGEATTAQRAAWNLIAAGDPAVTAVKKQLRITTGREHIPRLIADLDDDDFETREKAMRELANCVDEGQDALRKALDGKPSFEQRRRIKLLLAEAGTTVSELVRSLRALFVLEQIASPEAKSLLKKLADGADETPLTRPARAALQRLERRGAKP